MILPIYHTYQPPDVRSHFFHAGTMVQKRWKGLGRIWSVEHHIQLAHCVNFVTKERLSNSLIFSDLLQTKTYSEKIILHCCVLFTFYTVSKFGLLSLDKIIHRKINIDFLKSKIRCIYKFQIENPLFCQI